MTRLLLSTAALATLISGTPLPGAVAQSDNVTPCGNTSFCSVGGNSSPRGLGGGGGYINVDEDFYDQTQSGGFGRAGSGGRYDYEDASGLSGTCTGGGGIGGSGFHCEFVYPE